MKTTIPFSGFYNSVHDGLLDDAIEQMMQDESGDRHGELAGHLQFDCDFRKVFDPYVKAYVKAFAEEFKLTTLKFVKLWQPREYNFESDEITCEIDLAEVRRVFREVPVKDTVKAAERHQSRPGFHSFYSPNILEWGGLDKWDHHQLGTLMIALAGNDGFDSDKEMDLMEPYRNNGHITSWIEQATPNVERFYRIRDYLNKRKERT